MTGLRFAALAAALAAVAELAAALQVDLKCAVIVNEAFANANSDAGRTFQSASIPFDEIIIPPSGLQGDLQLEQGEGHGKYSCIVKGPTSYDQGGDYWVDAMTASQYAALQAYEVKYGVRRVVLESNPDAVPGLAHLDGFTSNGLPPAGTSATLTDAWKQAVPSSIVRPTAVFDLSQSPYQFGVYTIGSYIKTPSPSLTPLLVLNKASPAGTPLLGMLVEKDCTNTWERLHLFVSTRSPDSNSVALSYIWSEWVTKGLFVGSRRILLSTQVDDYFLPTELWDANPDLNEKTTGRVSPKDVDELIQWQRELNKVLPAGSNVKLEMAYNGMGVAKETRSEQDPWNNPIVLQYLEESPFGWQKPLGSGTRVWDMLPGNKFPDFTAAEVTQWAAKDPLFVKSRDQNVQKEFFWLTHTYTHLAFFNITSFDADVELKANEYFAKILGLEGKAWNSPAAMVTPRISGLFNGDALKMLADHGITSIVGDNSYSQLLPWKGNRYHGWTTNSTRNGYDGMFIIPRYALNVYFHMQDFEKNLQLYNIFYNQTLGMTDLKTFYERESWRCASQLLALQHDPYMTHQANLVMHPAPAGVPSLTKFSRQSLVTLWIEQTLEKVMRYLKLPVQTLKQQDLHEAYLARMALDNCGHTATANIGANGAIDKIQLRTSRACTVPLTGVAVSGRTPEANAGETRTWIIAAPNANIELGVSFQWKTTEASAPTPPTNTATTLIKNPQVETMAYWWSDGKGYTLGKDETGQNKTYGRVEGQSGDLAGAFQAVDFGNVVSSGVFTITANISADDLSLPSPAATAGFYVEVTWADGSVSVPTKAFPTGSYGWTGVSLTVNEPCKVPKSMNLHLLTRPGVTGVFRFTDVTVYSGVPSTSAAAPPKRRVRLLRA